MSTGKRIEGRFSLPGPAFLALLSLWCPSAVAAQTSGLQVTSVILVEGNQDMVNAAALIANLDAGDLVAGRTRWDHNGDGIVFAETRVGFSWSPVGGAGPFEIPDAEYYQPQLHTPTDISSDGTVVGWRVFTETLQFQPVMDTAGSGFQNLPFPPPSSPNPAGQASAISADGSVVVGQVQPDGPFSDAPTKATRWTLTPNGPQSMVEVALLAGTDVWSSARDVSSDGQVIVGDSGPTSTEPTAVRWTDGLFQALEPIGSMSSAHLTSDDGAVAVGIASVGEQVVLVQWNAAGVAAVWTPPAGASIKSINAVSSDGMAAAGVVASPDPDSPFGEDWTPFVWTQQHGLEVIPEVGQPADYDLSEALDVSDDGNRVVGTFLSSIIFEGEPPTLGFIWIRGTGVVLLNDLLSAAGHQDPDYWRVDAISGDGLRLLATGNPPDQTIHDTNSTVIELAHPADFNGDGVVNAADLAVLLGSWGPCPGCPADLDYDGAVGPIDLAQLLGSWG